MSPQAAQTFRFPGLLTGFPDPSHILHSESSLKCGQATAQRGIVNGPREVSLEAGAESPKEGLETVRS